MHRYIYDLMAWWSILATQGLWDVSSQNPILRTSWHSLGFISSSRALTKHKTFFLMMQILSLGYCVLPMTRTCSRKCKTTTESNLHDIPVFVRLHCIHVQTKLLSAFTSAISHECNFLVRHGPTWVRLVHRNFFSSGLFHHLCDAPCALKPFQLST